MTKDKSWWPDAARLYRQGATIHQVAAELHRCPTGVGKALRAQDVTIRRRGTSRDQAIVQAYRNGRTCLEIAAIVGLSESAVLKALDRNGIERRGRPTGADLTAAKKGKSTLAVKAAAADAAMVILNMPAPRPVRTGYGVTPIWMMGGR